MLKIKRISKVRILVLTVIFLLNACSTALKLDSPKRVKQKLINHTSLIKTSEGKSFEAKVRKKLTNFKRALKKGRLNKRDWKLHDELLDDYIQLKNYSLNRIIVPANSRVTLPLETYCLNSNKAPPVKKEVYHWQKSNPGIDYYSKLLTLRKNRQIKQIDLQELFWNLENKTNWDDYPNNLKAILQKVDSKAALKLPSRLKDQLTSVITDTVLDLPEGKEIFNKYNLIKGKYYAFKDFKQSVESLTSKYKLSDYDSLTKIPETDLYSQSISNGFKDQKVTFYNPTDKERQIDLDNYFLASERKDVQRVGVIQKPLRDSKLLTDLEKTLYEDMARLGVGFTPVVNDISDLYELLTGRDFVSGNKLSLADRLLSGVGVIVGSGQSYRYAKRAINSPNKYYEHFSKGLSKASKKTASFDSNSLKSSREALVQAKNKIKPIEGNLKNLKKSLKLVKRNNPNKDERREVIEAFTRNSSVKKLSKDTKVFRYSAEGKTLEKGHWVTTKKSKDPYNELALPKAGPYKVSEWTILKNTEVIEGLVAPNFGRKGGAHQVFVPNLKDLK